MALTVRQPRVVRRSLDPGLAELPRHLLDPFSREGVDDPGLLLSAGEKTHQLAEGLVLFHDGIADVRAVKACEEAGGVLQPQARDDVAPGLRVSGRGERHHRDMREDLAQDAELGVLGAEVVPPLGDAVRLVNGEEGDVQALDPLDETVGKEPLGGHVEELQLPRVQFGQDAARLGLAE